MHWEGHPLHPHLPPLPQYPRLPQLPHYDLLWLRIFHIPTKNIFHLSHTISKPFGTPPFFKYETSPQAKRHELSLHVTSFCFSSFLFVSRHFFLFHVISFCFTSFLFVSRHFFLFHIISLHYLFVFISYNFVSFLQHHVSLLVNVYHPYHHC